MAFQQITGGLNTVADVISAINAFAIANGWTSVGSPAGETWLMKTGSQDGVGDMYYGMQERAGDIEFTSALSYTNGDDFTDPPGGAVAVNGTLVGGPNSGFHLMDFDGDVGPYTSLCLFSNAVGDPCYIYAALEFNPGQFTHAQFGEFLKYDNVPEWTGGSFLETHNPNAGNSGAAANNFTGTQNLSLLNNNTSYFRFTSVAGAYHAQVPGNDTPWGFRGCATSVTGSAGDPYSIVIGGVTYQPHTYVHGSNEGIGGGFPYAAPIPIFMETNTDSVGFKRDSVLTPLGEFMDLYIGPMDVVTPKSQKEFGGVNYMPIPLSSTSTSITPNSGTAGMYIKINP